MRNLNRLQAQASNEVRAIIPFIVIFTSTITLLGATFCPQACVDTEQEHARGEQDSCTVPDSLILERIKANGLDPVAPDVIDTLHFELPITGAEGCRILVKARVPPIDLVFVKVLEKWLLFMENSEQVPSWKNAVSALLSKKLGQLRLQNPVLLAKELTRVLVDPDPRWGIVLDSRNTVPVSYEYSGFRSYLLQVKHMSEVDAGLYMLRRVPDLIRPPVIIKHKGENLLEFFSWQYHGGKIVKWRITLSPSLRAKRITSIKEVGSYGQ